MELKEYVSRIRDEVLRCGGTGLKCIIHLDKKGSVCGMRGKCASTIEVDVHMPALPIGTTSGKYGETIVPTTF